MKTKELECGGCGMSATVDRLDAGTTIEANSREVLLCPVCGDIVATLEEVESL